jgi:uncharacterized protein YcbX
MVPETEIIIDAVYIYPVKGLPGIKLDEARLEPDECLAFDRAFAFERTGPLFDPASPRHVDKSRFFNLVNAPELAALTARFDTATQTLELTRNGRRMLAAKLAKPAGRKAFETFIAGHLDVRATDHLRLVTAAGHHFTDIAPDWISVINLASIRALERALDQPLDPKRFRANVYVDGLDPWAELEWIGSQIQCGDTGVLEVCEPIARCAATNVNPATARADAAIPTGLADHFGHVFMGVYGRVDQPGRIAPGDVVSLPS